MGSLGAGEVNITIESQGQNAALVSKQSYYFLKLKRKRTEDATDINEVHKNGNIVAVTACNSSSECGRRCCFGQQQFQYSIVEPFGEEIVTIKGFQDYNGSSVVGEFTRGKAVLGRMTFQGDNSYQITNAGGENMFIIRGPSRCSLISCPCLMLGSRKSFNIFVLNNDDDNDGKQVGKIGDKWSGDNGVPTIDSNNEFGVSLPSEFEENESWILLASALVLRWQFWRPCNNSVWCVAYTIICIFFVVAVATFLIFVLG